MALDVNKTPTQIEIRKATGTLVENRKPGGNFDVSGNYGLGNTPSQVTVKLAGMNENGLRYSWRRCSAAAASVALDGTVSVQFGANGDAAVKADLQVTNLVVNDPAHQVPATPLEASCWRTRRWAKRAADVRQLQLTLDADATREESISTARARGYVQDKCVAGESHAFGGFAGFDELLRLVRRGQSDRGGEKSEGAHCC